MKSLQTEKGMQDSYEKPHTVQANSGSWDKSSRVYHPVAPYLRLWLVKITTKQQVVSKGDTVYVMVTVTSTTAMSGFEGFFTYDNTVLQFQTGGSVVYGNDDAFQISDIVGKFHIQILDSFLF